MPPLPGETPPIEFEPVFGAFNRMAADVRSSQRALEEARRRTDAVLATVATGVVALEPSGEVLIANRQASELLGIPLAGGVDLAAALPEEWTSLKDAVARFLADPRETTDAVELSIGVAALLLIFALVLLQAAQRYLPIDGWPWTGELARFGLVWLTFVVAGVLVSSLALEPSAAGKRLLFRNNDLRVIDGPFTESKELLGGFAVMELADMDEAVELCRRYAAILGGTLEIDLRQVDQRDEDAG
jgi:hypothetical protein